MKKSTSIMYMLGGLVTLLITFYFSKPISGFTWAFIIGGSVALVIGCFAICENSGESMVLSCLETGRWYEIKNIIFENHYYYLTLRSDRENKILLLCVTQAETYEGIRVGDFCGKTGFRLSSYSNIVSPTFAS